MAAGILINIEVASARLVCSLPNQQQTGGRPRRVRVIPDFELKAPGMKRWAAAPSNSA